MHTVGEKLGANVVGGVGAKVVGILVGKRVGDLVGTPVGALEVGIVGANVGDLATKVAFIVIRCPGAHVLRNDPANNLTFCPACKSKVIADNWFNGEMSSLHKSYGVKYNVVSMQRSVVLVTPSLVLNR